jgi:Ca2+-binding RTX toxin-like protein
MRAIAVAGLAVAGLVAVPGTAHAAGNVFVSGSALGIVAGAGDTNKIYVAEDAGSYYVRDLASPLVAGSGCAQLDPNTVRCTKLGVTVTRVDLKDLGDFFSNPTGLKDTVYAGTGDDEVRTGPGDDSLNGQDGADRLYGQDGIDQLDGGAGADFCDPAPGMDPAPVNC